MIVILKEENLDIGNIVLIKTPPFITNFSFLNDLYHSIIGIVPEEMLDLETIQHNSCCLKNLSQFYHPSIFASHSVSNGNKFEINLKNLKRIPKEVLKFIVGEWKKEWSSELVKFFEENLDKAYDELMIKDIIE